MDNAKAIEEIAYSTLIARPVQGETKSSTAAMAKDGKEYSCLVTLGGDHTIVLPILRSLYKVYGPISWSSIFGFAVIGSGDIDDYGIENVIKTIRDRVGMGPHDLALMPVRSRDGSRKWLDDPRNERGLARLNFLADEAPPKPHVRPFFDD
ncbi:hypothetical protein B0H19DRAFT_1261447 [Mycena capillaripes]|nr:hypothetical protein B0H19DRAFT_1261447 [Mycena capillaripes]